MVEIFLCVLLAIGLTFMAVSEHPSYFLVLTTWVLAGGLTGGLLRLRLPRMGNPWQAEDGVWQSTVPDFGNIDFEETLAFEERPAFWALLCCYLGSAAVLLATLSIGPALLDWVVFSLGCWLSTRLRVRHHQYQLTRNGHLVERWWRPGDLRARERSVSLQFVRKVESKLLAIFPERSSHYQLELQAHPFYSRLIGSGELKEALQRHLVRPSPVRPKIDRQTFELICNLPEAAACYGWPHGFTGGDDYYEIVEDELPLAG